MTWLVIATIMVVIAFSKPGSNAELLGVTAGVVLVLTLMFKAAT